MSNFELNSNQFDLSVGEFLSNLGVKFAENINLRKKTWIRTGGSCRYWVTPSNIEELKLLINWLNKRFINFDIVGNTSNCFYKSSYDPFLIISTLALNSFNIENNILECEPGVQISKIARYCNENGIAGYQGFIGLPGTLGGAVVNNAGCFGSLIAKQVLSVDILTPNGIKTLTNDEMSYEHRNSCIKDKSVGGTIVAIKMFADDKRPASELISEAEQFQVLRKSTQEYQYRTLGSTFAELNLKTLPKYKLLLLRLLQRALNIFNAKQSTTQKISTRYLLLAYNAPREVKNHISHYWLGCYTWRDFTSEKSFDKYVEFINRISTNAKLEIEIHSQENDRKL